jgi:fucose 4-O-acetylase-like acetyltransferase
MRYDIELIRIISAFGIVWYHSHVNFGRDVAYAGLICFLVISAFFATSSKHHHTISERFNRLIIPYISWSVLYALSGLIFNGRIFPANYTAVNMLLASPSVHLWYLPYIFFAIVSIDFLNKHVRRRFYGTGAGILAVIMIISAPYWRTYTFTPPWGQYLHASPALFIGIFLGSYFEIDKVVRMFVLTAIALSIAFTVNVGLEGFSITYAVGFVACLILLSGKSVIPENKIIRILAATTLGVYLLHVEVLFVLSHFIGKSYVLPTLSFLLTTSIVLLGIRFLPAKIKKIFF